MDKAIAFILENFVKPGWWDLTTFTGDANAPTLYDYDKNGFIKSSTNRLVTAEEQKIINDYNQHRAELSAAVAKWPPGIIARGTKVLSRHSICVGKSMWELNQPLTGTKVP